MVNIATSNTKQATGKATSMADLMKSAASSLQLLKKGEIVTGVITKLTSQEILLNINGKTEAVVLEKDKKILKSLLSRLKVGDTVKASVLNPESDMGYTVVSLRRFINDILWETVELAFKKREPVKVIVRESTKGGFLVDTTTGLSAFLPHSQMTASSYDTGDLIGKTIPVYLLEVSQQNRKIIVSQRKNVTKDEFAKVTGGLKNGEKVAAVVSHVTPFGIFVVISGFDESIDGFVHISEISWDKVENISGQFSVGQAIDAIVLGRDLESKRVDLSIKKLITDPYEEVLKKFTIDQKVSGIILKINSAGVFLSLEKADGGVEALIKKEKLPPTVSFKEGDMVSATISEIDTKRHRLILTPILKQKFVGYR